MKNKVKLAFEMLEQEMEVFGKEEQRGAFGGYGSSSGYNPLPNGYCLFNAIANIFDGTTANAWLYASNYEANNNEIRNYDSNGNFTGYSMSGNQMYNVISNADGGYATVNYVSSGSFSSSMFNGGARILAILTNAGPGGEQHAVEIKSVNSDGTFDYFDATTGNTVTGSSATVGNMFSIQCQ